MDAPELNHYMWPLQLNNIQNRKKQCIYEYNCQVCSASLNLTAAPKRHHSPVIWSIDFALLEA